MPEILKPGPESFTTQCTRCGCKFRYKLSETHRSALNLPGYINCPQCHSECRHEPQLEPRRPQGPTL